MELDGVGLIGQVRMLDLHFIMFLGFSFLSKHKRRNIFDFKLLENIVGAGMRVRGLIALFIVSITTARLRGLLRHDRLKGRMNVG